ncbi:alkyl hydroperoxide reductase AhpD [Longimycelium tulufanense]|uniref:Alkyl hydroperoxide reductase AhpD n=1 Tax=Longimycelium tulufanense TaxID=907463 RepID=A0A8J3FWT3_9PSEU|nr:carboxymuconolactone decarboxylase family protein [Longimycelium tulufanense]GGM80215.1 alkyl hydroperoxide reductase AhpD [Longimycelium tulufanense]
MSLDALKEALPAYAKDTRLNLGSVIGTSTLPAQQLWGTVLAVAVACRNEQVLRELDEAAREHLSAEAVQAARAAASIMAMNNVYYRAKHLVGDPEYNNLPARLRMQVIGNPGVDKVDFELWCLAVSAITGCGVCLESHEKALRKEGVPRETVHEALRIAGVVHAAAVTLDAERVLADA